MQLLKCLFCFFDERQLVARVRLRDELICVMRVPVMILVVSLEI